MSNAVLLDILLLNACVAIVNGSFFLNNPEYISASWNFICKQKIIGSRGFVACVPKHLQLAFVAELCRELGVLHSVKEDLYNKNKKRKTGLRIESDCQSAIH